MEHDLDILEHNLLTAALAIKHAFDEDQLIDSLEAISNTVLKAHKDMSRYVITEQTVDINYQNITKE